MSTENTTAGAIPATEEAPILTYPQLDALREVDPIAHTVESERHIFHQNGYCWGMGTRTSLTIKGQTSKPWKKGHAEAVAIRKEFEKKFEEFFIESCTHGDPTPFLPEVRKHAERLSITALHFDPREVCNEWMLTAIKKP